MSIVSRRSGLASLALFLTNVMPFAGVFLAHRAVTRLLVGADVMLVFAMYAYGTRRTGSRLSPLNAALRPFGTSVFIYAMFRSAYRAGGRRHRVAGYEVSS